MNLEESYGPIPLDTYFSTYVIVSDGSRAPAGVEQLHAECIDTGVCTARPRNLIRWPAVDIIPHREGATDVRVRYVHPGRKVAEEKRIRVTVGPKSSAARLTIGSPLPHVRDAVFVPASGARAAARCVETPDANLARAVGNPPPGIARLYQCHKHREVSPGDFRARATCHGLCPDSDASADYYALCVAVNDGVVDAIATFAPDYRSGTPTFSLVAREGAAGGACHPRP